MYYMVQWYMFNDNESILRVQGIMRIKLNGYSQAYLRHRGLVSD